MDPASGWTPDQKIRPLPFKILNLSSTEYLSKRCVNIKQSASYTVNLGGSQERILLIINPFFTDFVFIVLFKHSY